MRILVVDDHEVVRRGICSILAIEPTFELCGEAIDGLDAVLKAQELKPEAIVMDISMPNMNGLDATREIKRILPKTEVVIVSQHDSAEMVRKAMDAGARSYITKSAISAELLTELVKLNGKAGGKSAKARTASGSEAGQGTDRPQRMETDNAALRQSEQRFESAMYNIAEGVYIMDAEGRPTYLNSAAEKLLGWSSAELAGKRMHDIVHYKRADGSPYDFSDCPSYRILRDGAESRDNEDVFIRRDGTFFPVIVSSSPLRDGARISGAVVCFRDDSKRRKTEQDLRASESIYRAIGETIDYGIWICDPKGKNIFASPSFLRLVGLTQAECSEFGWAHVLHPDERDATIAAWRTCVETENFWEREHRFQGVDGKWHYCLARGGPVRDADGKVQYWAGINLDIQRQKETEDRLHHSVQTLEARISERTQALQSVSNQLRELSGKLLRTQDEERRRVARELHDGVGQLLAAMSMNIGKIMLQKSSLTPDAQHSLEENVGLLQQASQEIRTMSHLLHPPLLDEVGLESALRWYVDGFAERSKIAVQLEMPAGLGQALPRDLGLALFRIVQECLTNIHRHSESATAVVTVRRLRDAISLRVQDEGRGIASDIREKIISGEGSGVGLRGMRERVRQFGGSVEIHSDDSGTSIVATLPMATAGPAGQRISEAFDEPPSEAFAEAAVGAKLSTILCIDDEVAGLLVRKLLLESAGHRVIEARSGTDGIERFRSEKVDVVILDYWMSGMKGTTVAAQLKAINAAVPIVVLSGMSNLPGEAAGLVDHWLVKGSHRPEELLNCVATLLERRPA